MNKTFLSDIPIPRGFFRNSNKVINGRIFYTEEILSIEHWKRIRVTVCYMRSH